MQRTNELGFTRFEIANAKRAFAANKTIYRKMDALEAKIKNLAAQYDELEKLSMTWEAPINELTMQRLGVKLTSRELLAYCNDPQKFAEDHPNVVPSVTEEEDAPAENAEDDDPFDI